MMESSSFQLSVRRTTMKMAWLSVASVFLLCCSAVASQACQKYGLMGQNVNIPLGYTPKPTDAWKWKFKDKTIIYMKDGKSILKDGGESHSNGSLTLTNLKKEQEGIYKSEVYDKNGRTLDMKETKLCIVDPVKKPTPNATCDDQYALFECPLKNQPKGAKYEWLQNGVKMKKHENPFKIKAAETTNDKFVCKVFNEASSESSEPISHHCANDIQCPLRDLGFPDDLCWGLVGGGGGVVLLLIITVVVCCVRTKRTRKLRLQDEEELRLEWTITSQHPNHPPLPDHPPPHHPNRHHHHHHHHHQQQQQQEQQQAPGNTGPRQSRSKQNRQPRARAPEPNGQPQPSPRRTGQPQKPASDADDEQPPPLPQPRKKGPKTQLD